MFEIIKLLVAIFTLFILVKNLTNCQSKYIIFVCLVVWLRFFLSAFHEFTYIPIIAGLSINAISSILAVFFGLLVLPTRVFLLRKYIPFYCFISIVLISGVFNSEFKGLVNVTVKWAYFLVLTSAIILGMKQIGVNEALKRIALAFSMPVMLLFLSILLGEAKATENDGSTSYVGGYNHEAAFSMIIVGFILSISFIKSNQIKFHSLLFWTSVVMLFLVNYRTAIIAVLPVIIIFILTAIDKKIESKMRIPVLFISTVFISVVGIFFSSSFSERFADISVFLTSWDSLIKAPAYFTEFEKDIFSARVYLWSQYLTEVFNADTFHRLIGFGPESWSGIFDNYAHNIYVSYMYEYGFLGLIFFLISNAYLFILSFSIRDDELKYKLSFSLFGFLLMNLATMPIWSIEGLIMYALIIGMIFTCSFRDKISTIPNY